MPYICCSKQTGKAGGIKVIKGIIFDLFGTLVDNKNLYSKISKEISEDSHQDFESIHEEFINLYKLLFKDYHLSSFKPEKYYYGEIIKVFKEKYDLEKTVEEYLEHMYDAFAEMPPYEDTSVLEKLYDEYKIAILTNADNYFVEKLLKKRNIKYHSLITSEGAACYKPSKEIFEFTADKIGLKFEEMIFIGDVPEVDIAGGQNAGVYSLLIDRENRHPDFKPSIDSLTELDGLIHRLNSKKNG